MSATLTKTYNIASGVLQFIFDYNDNYTLGDFDIVDISPLSYGYDSADNTAIAVYPSSIDITITDFNTDNYNVIKELYEKSSKVYPFTGLLRFKLTIVLNGAIIFTGTVDDISSRYGDATITLSFTDGIELYKNAEVGNPYVLWALADQALIPRRISLIGNTAYAYGFNELDYVIDRGFTVSKIDQVGADRSVNIGDLVKGFIRMLSPNIEVEFDNRYKYGQQDTPTASMVSIEATKITRVLSYLLGRYVSIRKNGNFIPVMTSPLNSAEEYPKAEYFELVFEDDDYVVYRHTWKGTTNSSMTFYKGVDDVTIAGLLNILAQNTFSYYGFKADGKFFFRHKRYKSAPIQLSDIISMTKAMAGEKVDYVNIKDYNDGARNYAGVLYPNSNKIEFGIPLSAYRTPLGWFNTMSYNSNGEKRVDHFYDPEIERRGTPTEVIADAEYRANQQLRDQYDFELGGIDYAFDKSYSVSFGNYSGVVRPITIEKDLLNNRTTMSGLEL